MAKEIQSPSKTPDTPTRVETWTVMMLMGADNVGEEQPLLKYAKEDIEEMRSVKQTAVSFVVQLDRKDDGGLPVRYFINGGTQIECLQPDDIVDQEQGPGALKEFLSWSMRKYPADHYMLILWGHAYRLAFNRSPSDPDGLDFPRLKEALASTEEAKIDIVAFDSCNVGLIESAYELRNVAKYMVASQFTDPLPGWQYGVVFNRDFATRSSDTGEDATEADKAARDLGRVIVSQFVRHYAGEHNVTMTMLDLAKTEDVASLIGDLARELILDIDAGRSERDQLQADFERSQVPINQPAVDLATLCWNLMNFSSSEPVRIAAAALGDLLLRPTNPFIVAHGKSDLFVSMLQGVSIFAPNVPSNADPSELRAAYAELDMERATLWGGLVFDLADNR